MSRVGENAPTELQNLHPRFKSGRRLQFFTPLGWGPLEIPHPRCALAVARVNHHLATPFQRSLAGTLRTRHRLVLDSPPTHGLTRFALAVVRRRESQRRTTSFQRSLADGSCLRTTPSEIRILACAIAVVRRMESQTLRSLAGTLRHDASSTRARPVTDSSQRCGQSREKNTCQSQRHMTSLLCVLKSMNCMNSDRR